jgi:preprotein translocase subunit SecG
LAVPTASSSAADRVELPTVRDFVTYVTVAIFVVSSFAMIAGILMHSGRGGGLSDMFGGGGGAAMGSSAAERNLNRITFVIALVWIFSVTALSFLLVS